VFVCVCIDIDECKAGLGDCSISEAECVNTAGGYFCQCKTGFSGDGQHCMGTTTHTHTHTHTQTLIHTVTRVEEFIEIVLF